MFVLLPLLAGTALAQNNTTTTTALPWTSTVVASTPSIHTLHSPQALNSNIYAHVIVMTVACVVLLPLMIGFSWTSHTPRLHSFFLVLFLLALAVGARLAFIGHAQQSTTRFGASSHATFGIVVIMSIAIHTFFGLYAFRRDSGAHSITLAQILYRIGSVTIVFIAWPAQAFSGLATVFELNHSDLSGPLSALGHFGCAHILLLLAILYARDGGDDVAMHNSHDNTQRRPRADVLVLAIESGTIGTLGVAMTLASGAIVFGSIDARVLSALGVVFIIAGTSTLYVVSARNGADRPQLNAIVHGWPVVFTIVLGIVLVGVQSTRNDLDVALKITIIALLFLVIVCRLLMRLRFLSFFLVSLAVCVPLRQRGILLLWQYNTAFPTTSALEMIILCAVVSFALYVMGAVWWRVFGSHVRYSPFLRGAIVTFPDSGDDDAPTAAKDEYREYNDIVL